MPIHHFLLGPLLAATLGGWVGVLMLLLIVVKAVWLQKRQAATIEREPCKHGTPRGKRYPTLCPMCTSEAREAELESKRQWKEAKREARRRAAEAERLRRRDAQKLAEQEEEENEGRRQNRLSHLHCRSNSKPWTRNTSSRSFVRCSHAWVTKSSARPMLVTVALMVSLTRTVASQFCSLNVLNTGHLSKT